MQYVDLYAAWQLVTDRRERLMRDVPRSRLRRIRPRPPVDDASVLPRPPSTGGLPPAA